MLYSFIKSYARLAIKIYCPYIAINKPELLQSEGPLLLACNHPNSFLDGIVLTTLFNQPVYSLARGDVFKKAWIRKTLLWLKLLPVYRTSEGAENLEQNYTTFKACRKVFRKQHIVLIFSEAGSTNEWHLRPLRKGTARLAISSWKNGINLKVVPVAINYSSFRKFGKNIHIYFGDFIEPVQVMHEDASGKQLLAFNSCLQRQLERYVYEIAPGDKATIRRKFQKRQSLSQTVVLALPALLGFIIHWPYYTIVKFFTTRYFKNSDHYDAVLTALLLLTYPFFLLIITAMSGYFFNASAAVISLLLLPFLAWAVVLIKYQLNL